MNQIYLKSKIREMINLLGVSTTFITNECIRAGFEISRIPIQNFIKHNEYKLTKEKYVLALTWFIKSRMELLNNFTF